MDKKGQGNLQIKLISWLKNLFIVKFKKDLS